MNDNDAKINRLIRQNDILREKLFLIHEYIVSKENDIYFEMDRMNSFEIKNKNSSKTIIAFSGMLTSLAMPKAEFFKSLIEKDVNIIFLKDFYQCWYQKGLLGISKDVGSTVDFLKSIIPTETEDLYCIGTSSGGFAALLVGSLIGAKKTVSFSPQTYIDQNVFLKFRTPESRWDKMKNSPYLDVRRYLRKNTLNDIYFGKNNSLDSEFAKYLILEDSCELKAVNTDSHNVAKFLKENKQLDSILSELIEF